MIFKMKVPKKWAFMITISSNFLFLKYDVVHQWCISWKLRQISNREIKLVVFPALHICQKIAQNRPWWVLGGFLVLTESIMSVSFWNLIYEMNHTCCWLILPFWVSISSSSPSRQSFYCFFTLFIKENINFAYFNEKSTWFSSEICFGYFEQIWKDFADYQVKTN